MVGHTGFMDPTVKAVETVDTCVGKVVKAVRKAGGDLLITADHGNADLMLDPDSGKPFTAHTVNPVPLVYCGPKKAKLRKDGILADLAPTMLDLLELKVPGEMEGKSLLIGKK